MMGRVQKYQSNYPNGIPTNVFIGTLDQYIDPSSNFCLQLFSQFCQNVSVQKREISIFSFFSRQKLLEGSIQMSKYWSILTFLQAQYVKHAPKFSTANHNSMSTLDWYFWTPPITFLKNPRISKSVRYSTVKLRKMKKIRK